MITNADITLYHYDEDNEQWTKNCYFSVHFFADNLVSVDDTGLSSADVVKIRIPTRQEVPLCNGDRIVRGISLAPAPDRNNCFTVISWSDNRRGTAPHYRVRCR